MKANTATKVDAAVLLDVLLMMSQAAGRGLDVQSLARALKTSPAQVRQVFGALVVKEWLQHCAEDDTYYATVTFWVVGHIIDNHFKETVNTLPEPMLARMGMPETPELEGMTLQ